MARPRPLTVCVTGVGVAGVVQPFASLATVVVVAAKTLAGDFDVFRVQTDVDARPQKTTVVKSGTRDEVAGLTRVSLV